MLGVCGGQGGRVNPAGACPEDKSSPPQASSPRRGGILGIWKGAIFTAR
jgi:hypothetical protein